VSAKSGRDGRDFYRFRTGIAWRDLPKEFGPGQTVWERHQRFSIDGTYDKIHARLLALAFAAGDLEWMVSVDSSINRADQHATNLDRVKQPSGDSRAARSARAASRAAARTGG